MNRRRIMPAVLALTAATTLLLTGCAGADVDQMADPGRTPSPSVSSPPGPYEEQAQRRATAAYPAKADMPSGWIQVDPSKELGESPGVPAYCGVTVRPDPMKGGMLHLYEETDAGPYLLQFTYVTEQATAEKVMADLAAGVTKCLAAGTDKDGAVMAPLKAPTVGEESVSVMFVPTGAVPSQVTVFRRGNALVTLVGWNPAGLPPVDALATVAAAVDAKVGATRS